METYEEDLFSFIVNEEIRKYYDSRINVYVSILEDYDNWIIVDDSDVKNGYMNIYDDVFGQNKTFFKRRDYGDNEMLVEKIVNGDISVYLMRNHFAAHFGCDLDKMEDLSWLDFYDINIANCEKNNALSSVIYSNNPFDYIKEGKFKNILKLKKIENKRRLNRLMENIFLRKV
jgi:hypothetical protein